MSQRQPSHVSSIDSSDANGLHIVHLTPGFPADATDDVCIPALQDFLESLVERSGPEFHRVVSLHYPRRRSSYPWNGATVHTVGCRANLVVRMLDWRRAGALLAKLHAEQPIDVLHAYFLSDAALVAARFVAQKGVPLVLTAMGQDVLPANRYLGILDRLTARLEQVVFAAPSERCAALLQSLPLGRRGVEVVPWGVRPFASASRQGERDIDFLGVGSLTANKDFEQLVRLPQRLKEASETVGRLRVVLVGDGRERQRIEQRVSDLGVSSFVEVWGQRSRQEARAAMARARVLVHPSRYESFGLVFAEAAAAGMSIVSRAVGCAPDQSIPGWSVFEDAEDLPGLALASLSTPSLSSPSLSSPSLSATSLRVRFPVEQTCGTYEGLYAGLVR